MIAMIIHLLLVHLKVHTDRTFAGTFAMRMILLLFPHLSVGKHEIRVEILNKMYDGVSSI